MIEATGESDYLVRCHQMYSGSLWITYIFSTPSGLEKPHTNHKARHGPTVLSCCHVIGRLAIDVKQPTEHFTSSSEKGAQVDGPCCRPHSPSRNACFREGEA